MTTQTMTHTAEQLIAKLKNKTAIVGVVGLGYVGLPLAVEKAKAGYQVIGFDVQQEKVRKVNRGENYIGDVVAADLEELVQSDQLKATADYSFIGDVDALAICVPTPLDVYKQPNMEYVQNSAKAIAKHMTKGTLVVLESTTYPGTTEELIKPILEESGLVCGQDFFLAYSPERVDPGNKDFNTKNTPKVVGGMTDACTQVAATMYRSVLEGDVHEVSSPAVAEMEKLLENTFRNINIALANEMAILCNKMGIDVWEVIDAAATKPYGFMAFYPGPGLGGHCIPIDPWYLTWKAREYNYHTKLIETAGEINDSMPEFVIQRCMEILNEQGKALKDANVVVLGVAYKKDIDDYRESPVLPILEKMTQAGARWTVADPHVQEFKLKGKLYQTARLTEELLEQADLTVIATNHSLFDYEMIMKKSQAIFDTRNTYRNKEQSKYLKL
ncbi:nucleotide sugar dehydrogenase [Pseudobacillus badius]|uniref:nucleotide sugar dehydrogenase n=1 Tax=Bacillus badius TaxID=1455 RepID=UPI0007B085D9|nr:nucleotide sugar dehydrogenase [Bacillus badius]KZO00017.1 UDP-N-acetyl-D-glucosamine dehydrogenase [Bacillus badius]OCS86178.1 UDP-N-acetyl-D-glucosamine dehydrogenase [Bacillus badius]OVE52361.1 UDP-N-acetyl-D-glucosamine dehydrogenase [Bacillus badius]TDW04092.1 UDP-N-acetyl-D-glucosamine dehydrogenase [Bacillus badius]UAT30489.1 nucleotide sugar dehydrogenase [Bacillus badius]